MTKLIFFFCILISLTSARAQGDIIINVDARKTTRLNGQWRYIVDPYENGYYNYRYQESANGYFKNHKPDKRWERVEYDFDKSPTLSVPGDWNSQDERLFFYEGTVWYKKSFDYSLPKDRRLFVYFGAANYHAIVYLNGQKLGEHVGGFTPFNFEITGIVKEKDNFLVVKVDNKRRRDGVPTLNTDWWNYGGLTRRVMLVETPATFIRDYFIQLKKGEADKIAGWVRLSGSQKNEKITLEIPGAGIKKSFKTDDGYLPFSLPAKVTLWSPERPKLYNVILSTKTDEVRDEIGFRGIETRGQDILLNGKPLFLRGISIHEEAPIRSGRAFSREDARTLLGWAKELGCNFVRLAHYPHNEFMTREADRLGLLVWSEIPVYWTILWENAATFANAADQLTTMIARDKNKASVILWSMSNETPLNNSRLEFLKKLVKKARTLDPTRLITAAMERHYTNPTTQLIDDPLGAYLDVLGCNEYIGWYDGLPAKADHIKWETIYDKPLIMSEFGGGALFNHHGDTLSVWTEEYQENLYRHQIGMIKKIPFLRGITPWILVDFRSPRRHLPGIQDFWNRKGLISDRGEKKKAFYVLRKYYRELKQSK